MQLRIYDELVAICFHLVLRAHTFLQFFSNTLYMTVLAAVNTMSAPLAHILSVVYFL